jgi:hypothetical protein
MAKANKNMVTLPDVYKFYCTQTDDPVDYKTHKLILELWGEMVVEALIEGHDISLYSGLSRLSIRKSVSRTYIDRQATKKAGKVIRRSNSHSGYHTARIMWHRHYTRINSAGWVFIPTRKLKDKLNVIMSQPGGHRRYIKRMHVATSEKHAKIIARKKLGI